PGCSPPILVVGEFSAPNATSDTACCGSSPQSRTPTSVLTTNWMIAAPPGEPSTANSCPRAPGGPAGAGSNTIVGAIVLRGRLPGWTRLATGVPSSSTGSAAKSVSWLFSMNPSTIRNEPNDDSMEVVNAAALPCASTMLMWLVPCSGTGTGAPAGASNSPGGAVP